MKDLRFLKQTSKQLVFDERLKKKKQTNQQEVCVISLVWKTPADYQNHKGDIALFGCGTKMLKP